MNVRKSIILFLMATIPLLKAYAQPSDDEILTAAYSPNMTCINFIYKKDTIQWGDDNFAIYSNCSAQLKETRKYSFYYGGVKQYDSLAKMYYGAFPIDSHSFCFEHYIESRDPDSINVITIVNYAARDSMIIKVSDLYSDSNYLLNNIVYDRRVHEIVFDWNTSCKEKVYDKQRRSYVSLNGYYKGANSKKKK